MINFITLKINYKFIAIILVAITLFSFICIYTSVNANSLSDENPIKVPIIMYHSILKSQSGDYIIHPNVLEKDLEYISKKGYQTITISDLINYVYNDTPLPEKPIILTFDDGHYNNLGYAVPLLKKYNMKAVISIVGNYTETFSKSDEANLNYGYLRWKDINSLIDSGIIEFQNHTYNLHSIGRRTGAKKMYNESKEHYENVLTNDLQKLQDEFTKNTGYTPNAFTYPYGAISNDSFEIIKNLGFKASLSCGKGINYITKDKNCLYCLKRNNRSSSFSTEQFFKNLLE